MTKENACAMLAKTMVRFQAITHESIGVVYSWRGGVSTIGTEKFRNFVALNKEEIWRALAFTKDEEFDIPERDLEMSTFLNDIPRLNVPLLRKVASWATRRTLGMYYVSVLCCIASNAAKISTKNFNIYSNQNIFYPLHYLSD